MVLRMLLDFGVSRTLVLHTWVCSYIFKLRVFRKRIKFNTDIMRSICIFKAVEHSIDELLYFKHVFYVHADRMLWFGALCTVKETFIVHVGQIKLGNLSLNLQCSGFVGSSIVPMEENYDSLKGYI